MEADREEERRKARKSTEGEGETNKEITKRATTEIETR